MRKTNIETKLKNLLSTKEELTKDLKHIRHDSLTEKARFELVAPAYGLRRSCFGKEIQIGKGVFKIIGINEKSRVAPIILESRSKSVMPMQARTVRKALDARDTCITGVQIIRYRNDVDTELHRIQKRFDKIIKGRDELYKVLPIINSDEYFNEKWTVEENKKAIGGFTKRRASIIAQWTEAANGERVLALRRIAAFLVAVYSIEPWKAYYAASKSFSDSNFVGSLSAAEKYLVKLEDEFSDPQIVDLEKWIEDILSGKIPVLTKVRD